MWTADKNMNMKATFAVMNTTWAAVKTGPVKNIVGLYGIWTHDLCDTGAVLYQETELTCQLGAGLYVGSK